MLWLHDVASCSTRCSYGCLSTTANNYFCTPFAQTALAMCTVLSTTLTRVPNGVLRSKFVGSVQLLSAVVDKHREQVCKGHTAMCQTYCLAIQG